MSHWGKTSRDAVEKLFSVVFFFFYMLARFWARGNLTCFDVRGNEIRISSLVSLPLFILFFFYVQFFFFLSLSPVSFPPCLLDPACSSSMSCRGRLRAEENIHGS